MSKLQGVSCVLRYMCLKQPYASISRFAASYVSSTSRTCVGLSLLFDAILAHLSSLFSDAAREQMNLNPNVDRETF